MEDKRKLTTWLPESPPPTRSLLLSKYRDFLTCTSIVADKGDGSPVNPAMLSVVKEIKAIGAKLLEILGEQEAVGWVTATWLGRAFGRHRGSVQRKLEGAGVCISPGGTGPGNAARYDGVRAVAYLQAKGWALVSNDMKLSNCA